MDPIHLSESEEESSYGIHAFEARRKGALQEMQREKGEVVHVKGGRIVRSTGRKDRHSKVYTARGTRDRRLRLSPNTAIQFYDVQDRLGYDRPSKAIDWLMKEAKAQIDALNAPTSLNEIEQKQKQTSSDQFSFLNSASFQEDSSSVFFFDDDQQGLLPAALSYPGIQRLITWNSNQENGKPENEPFNNYFPPVFAQSQREPLQSTNFPPLSTHNFSYSTMGLFANNIEFPGLSATRRIHDEHSPVTGASLLDYQH